MKDVDFREFLNSRHLVNETRGQPATTISVEILMILTDQAHV
jgi:hypothetical protein